MSKSVASESTDDNESHKTGRKRGSGDEEKENGEGTVEGPAAKNSTTLTTVSTVPATTDQFMFTNNFKRLLVGFIMGDTLMTLRLATKAWKRVVDAFIDEGVESGAMMVHGGNDVIDTIARARAERRKFVMRVIFHLNVTKVGNRTCMWAANLVVVDIPEGVETIGVEAFHSCSRLTTVYFPKTLTLVGQSAFGNSTSLENVDLLHANLQELVRYAFGHCSELKSMTIPDSLKTVGYRVFFNCPELDPPAPLAAGATIQRSK
ncbi:hypothetical protein TrLO_g15722 [Triparma laevis f. longispina]|uniref:Uncharacterized protein n=1 Tax=Triparma laevis f. longispina TaxID=1714387 RepID=A0A9W7E7V6_9STRA|nr:hypothetical protein TrLO_g15722 [Triparma laevis f. longispina]